MPRAEAKVERIAELMVGRKVERTELPCAGRGAF
jgi:hypothetical protein